MLSGGVGIMLEEGMASDLTSAPHFRLEPHVLLYGRIQMNTIYVKVTGVPNWKGNCVLST